MEKMYLSVVILAYNKAENLPITLIDIDKHLRSADFNYEILIIDNFSNDNTADVVHKFLPVVQGLRLIENNKRSGNGEIMRQGIKESKGQFILFMSADNIVGVNHFFQMTSLFEGENDKKYDIVIGSRYIQGSNISPPYPFFYRVCNFIGNLIIKILILPGVKDAQCDFKCFTRESALHIFPVIKTDHLATDIEILAIGRKIGYKIKEIPIAWANNNSNTVKLSTYFYILRDLFKIKVWIWKNDYKLSK